jgi:hypothetical protein
MLEMLLSLDFVKNLLKEYGFVKLEEEVETSISKLEELLNLGSIQTKMDFSKDKFTIYVTLSFVGLIPGSLLPGFLAN